MDRWIERLLAELERPLTVAQYLALHAVYEGQNSAAELARQAAVSQPAVSQLVAALGEAGLLERAPAQDDRRRRPLALTAAGRTALREARAHLESRLAEPLQALPEPEARALQRSLAQVEALLLGTPPPRRPAPPPKKPHERKGRSADRRRGR